MYEAIEIILQAFGIRDESQDYYREKLFSETLFLDEYQKYLERHSKSLMSRRVCFLLESTNTSFTAFFLEMTNIHFDKTDQNLKCWIMSNDPMLQEKLGEYTKALRRLCASPKYILQTLRKDMPIELQLTESILRFLNHGDLNLQDSKQIIDRYRNQCATVLKTKLTYPSASINLEAILKYDLLVSSTERNYGSSLVELEKSKEAYRERKLKFFSQKIGKPIEYLKDLPLSQLIVLLKDSSQASLEKLKQRYFDAMCQWETGLEHHLFFLRMDLKRSIPFYLTKLGTYFYQRSVIGVGGELVAFFWQLFFFCSSSFIPYDG